MKTKLLLPAVVLMLLFTTAATAQYSLPVTAASFPYSVIDKDSGSIEFNAKLTGFSGYIDGTGRGPFFFILRKNIPGPEFYEYSLGFNSNDGTGDGGLVSLIGPNRCGTSYSGYWTYANIFGSDEAAKQWHSYRLEWNVNGLPQLGRQHQVMIYLDGVQNTTRWGAAHPVWPVIDGGTFNLITTESTPYTPYTGEIAMDEIKIYNGKGELVLHNHLGSIAEIENSVVGPDGSFNGFGDAHFVEGTDGNALSAHPVFAGDGTFTTCNNPTGLWYDNITAASARINWNAPASPVPSYKIRYNVQGSPVVYKRLVKGTATRITLHDLQPNTTYEWKMRSACADDKSDWIQGPVFTTTEAFAAVAAADALSVDITGNKLLVYPNPNKGQFTIQAQLPGKAAPTTFTLYNNLGEQVWQYHAGSISGQWYKAVALDNQLTAGMYVLTLQRDDLKLTTKLMISK